MKYKNCIIVPLHVAEKFMNKGMIFCYLTEMKMSE